jgi:hypothetical protein
MCSTCGCGQPDDHVKIIVPGEKEKNKDKPGHDHVHTHSHDHQEHSHAVMTMAAIMSTMDMTIPDMIIPDMTIIYMTMTIVTRVRMPIHMTIGSLPSSRIFCIKTISLLKETGDTLKQRMYWR